MGRPRLYHTADERAAANREKSKKHYEKKKRSINKKRRKEYNRKHQAMGVTKIMPETDSIQSASVPADPLQTWMEGVERVHRSLRREVGDAPQDYAEEICRSFLEHQDKDRVYAKIVQLGKLQKSIYRYQDEVYALEGVGPKHGRAVEVSKEVCTILGWIEEILCLAMVDFTEVKNCYVAKGFMYQVK